MHSPQAPIKTQGLVTVVVWQARALWDSLTAPAAILAVKTSWFGLQQSCDIPLEPWDFPLQPWDSHKILWVVQRLWDCHTVLLRAPYNRPMNIGSWGLSTCLFTSMQGCHAPKTPTPQTAVYQTKNFWNKRRALCASPQHKIIPNSWLCAFQNWTYFVMRNWAALPHELFLDWSLIWSIYIPVWPKFLLFFSICKQKFFWNQEKRQFWISPRFY